MPPHKQAWALARKTGYRYNDLRVAFNRLVSAGMTPGEAGATLEAWTRDGLRVRRLAERPGGVMVFLMIAAILFTFGVLAWASDTLEGEDA